MKFNLKNRPKTPIPDELLKIPQAVWEGDVREYEDWFEGFEKELQKCKKQAKEDLHSSNFSYDEKLRIQGQIHAYKEVLGADSS